MEQKRLNEYIRRAKVIHGDKYDYSKADAQSCKDKTIFICPIHGEFQQTWDNHIHGKSGCPKCAKCHKYTNEEWIAEASKRHCYKYDYSKTHYIKAKSNVVITCHVKDDFGEEHGDFEIRAGNHMAGIGCPKCAKKYKPTTEEWIKKAKLKHGDKYDYSKVKYIGGNKKVLIICPIHGEFWQEATSHLQGCGCPKCNGGVELTTNEWISRARAIHGNKYDYSNVKYINAKEKINITCYKHGEFWQRPYQHLMGQGCPKCKSSKLENILMKLMDTNSVSYTYQYKLVADKTFWCDFLLDDYNVIIECQGEQHFIPTSFEKDKSQEKCKATYQNILKNDALKYDECIKRGYDVIYFTIPDYFNTNKVIIQTDFYKNKRLFTDTSKLLDYIVKQNKVFLDKSFDEFFNDVKENITDNIININNTIRYKDYIVLYIPLKSNNRNDLAERRRMLVKEGYKTIIVFEDEYINKRKIVLSKIRHLFKLDNLPRIMARKCIIKEIDKTKCADFLEKNHIQGFVASTIYFGAFYDNRLIAVMSFKKENQTTDDWELTRFASDNNYICCGVGGKLFKNFIKNYDYKQVKSFADRRWTYNETKNIYLDLGFVKETNMSPEYRYFKGQYKHRYHKFGFRKQKLHKRYDLPLTMTEGEMTKELGYERIWDCGLIKYIYVNPIDSESTNTKQRIMN